MSESDVGIDQAFVNIVWIGYAIITMPFVMLRRWAKRKL